jgi:hypothetical protein
MPQRNSRKLEVVAEVVDLGAPGNFLQKLGLLLPKTFCDSAFSYATAG